MNENNILTLTNSDALIVVDVQQDFLPGGSLAVPNGDQVVPVLNRCMALFEARSLPIFATRDWHPANHCSFKEQGGRWPSHCVQHSEGAKWAPGLTLPNSTEVISKDYTPTLDTYSGFQQTDLAAKLRQCHSRRIFIGGLATDYCVLHTTLDGMAAGFKAVVLEDAIRAVNIEPDDGTKALARMQAAGARISSLQELSDASE